MSVKSSEVLRLAAEYAFLRSMTPLADALQKTAGSSLKVRDFAEQAAYYEVRPICDFKHMCMALCLAAAIAEDAGD